MFWFRHLLLPLWFLGCLYSAIQAWRVDMPRNIKALLNSCLVIPCSFDYNSYPPKRADRVVWYQYVSRAYPLVYDNWNPMDVISSYRGRTNVYTSTYRKSCTLQIEHVNWNDDRQKLYPWVDPENVWASTYKFYDTTVTIEVLGQPKPPRIEIFGERKVGKSVTVKCSAEHTCSTRPPTLSLNIAMKDKRVSGSQLYDGTSKAILTVTLVLERDSQVIECTVQHPGGKTARTSETLTAECSIFPLSISSTSAEYLEGVPSQVTCEASYTCSNNAPVLEWNYSNMPVTRNVQTLESLRKTVSTLTFTASAKDNGKYLTCSANFPGGQTLQKSLTIRVKRNMFSLGWTFTTPGSVTGMKGSCVVIPCEFSYTKAQPGGLQVFWYLYQSNGRADVFNQRQSNILSRYNGITHLTGSVSDSNCSLKIDRLDMSHNEDKLYPWVDINPITSYHSQGYSFLDKSTKIMVSDQAQEPQMSIIDVPKVGAQSRVTCKVQHTCSSAPPVLSLNGIPGTDRTIDSLLSDGIWERTIERTWNVEEDHKKVECTVRYPGGQSAKSELLLHVECPFDTIKMVEPPGELTEGVAKSVICSVSYKCKTNTPTIEWNFSDMLHLQKFKQISSNTFTTESNLTFIGSLEDNGKPLTCIAHFVTGETSNSSLLQIKKYVPVQEELNEKDTFRVLAADVPGRFNALTRSCVVIPCSFQDDEDQPLTRGIWYKKTGGKVYHNARSDVLDHFKDRTKILGNLDEGDCSLEIDDIKPFDNGPFCFYGQKGTNTYRFNNSCVFIVMKASPEKPVMSSVPAQVNAGSTVKVSCSVSHSCSSHPPKFSWSVPSINNEVSDTAISRGVWKTTSTITFVVAGGDGQRNLNCTAIFWRGKNQTRTFKLIVEGTMAYQMQKSVPVVIPVVFLLLILFAVLLGIFFYRKRKHADGPLTPPPRPEKRRSLWGRLTRRHFEGDREKPPRPEKRRSVWSRFSRQSEEGQVGWQNTRESFWNRFSRRPNNSTDLRVSYLNNAEVVVCEKKVNKQHYPSPKNNRRRPAPPTPEDVNLYGNI